MKSPLDFFFNLGNRLDIKRKADFDFYLLIVMFVAFATILFDNLYRFFFVTYAFTNLGWSFVMLAILYFQYFGMKGAYEMRKMIKNQPKVDEKVESTEEMLSAFTNNEVKEDKQDLNNELENIRKEIDLKTIELNKLFDRQNEILELKKNGNN